MKRVLALGLFLVLAGAAHAATRTVTLAVSGWTCASCAAATRIALKKLDGVSAVVADVEKSEAVVTYDDARTTPGKMIGAVGKLGYKASVKGAAPAETASAPKAGHECAPGEVEAAALPASHAKAAGVAASAASTTVAATRPRSVSADRVSVFETPMGCWAVEGLGCGSLSKPVLAELESEARIAEAWMNRSGTLVAVIWKGAAAAKSGAGAVEEIFDARGLEAKALAGPAREKALADFLGGSKWYRSAEVDRLSEEEARVVATRLVRRTEKSLALTPEQAAALRDGLTVVFTRHFVRRGSVDPGKIGTELMEVAGRSLQAGELARFEEALRQGIGALPEETD